MDINNLSEDFQKHVQRAKELASNRLLRPNFFGNVVGVGLGYKVVDKEPTDTVCVRIYVQSKIELDDIAPSYLLPSSFLDIPTDIIEVGNIGRKEISPLQPVGEIHPGSAIRLNSTASNVNSGAVGTLGAVVIDRRGQRYILSCNHILAVNGRVKTDPNIQIVAADTSVPPTPVARPGHFVPLKRNQANRVDCALAPVIDEDLVARTFPFAIGDVSSAASAAPRVGQKVRKIGAITGLTHGTIVDVDADLFVDFSFGTFLFTGQIVIDGLMAGQDPTFANDGDSGAILFDENQEAKGMIFAEAGRFAVACPFSEVLSHLGELLEPTLPPIETKKPKRPNGPKPVLRIDTSRLGKKTTTKPGIKRNISRRRKETA